MVRHICVLQIMIPGYLYICVLGSLGFTWFHLGIVLLTWVHLGLPGSTWVHLVSLGFTWVQLGLLWFTLIHLGSAGLTRVHLGLLGFNWVLQTTDHRHLTQLSLLLTNIFCQYLRPYVPLFSEFVRHFWLTFNCLFNIDL